MQSNRINRLIIRLIDNTITDEESIVLSEWLKEDKNQHYFNEFIATNQLLTERKTFDPKKLLPGVYLKKPTKKRNYKIFYFAAAIFVLGLTIYKLQPTPKIPTVKTNNAPLIVNNQIQTGTNKAILTLSNGSKIVLGKKSNYNTAFIKTDSASISYADNDKSALSQEAYNTLTIPRGGQFTLKLSDGSTVWLNSESEIRFPVSFHNSKLRNVELMYGEAYFSISPSTKNGGSKFMVHQGKQTIEVLGTQFNVKAYKGDKSIITTLVEGKIAIHYNTIEKTMKANEQATSNLNNGSLKIKNIDVSPEISWKEGEFSFKEESLKNIMQVLSRWYDMDVVFENKSLEEVKFKGVLRKNLKIEEIMSIMMTTSINNYEINKHKIILK